MQKLSMDQLNRVDVDTFKSQEKTPVVIVLDNVRSMHNVGSAFRTADAFAIDRIVLCGITATPPHREIEKTALGATQSVTWTYEKSSIDAIKNLKEEGFEIYAIEQTNNSISLETFEPLPDKKYAVVFGNEVHGVEEEIIALADGTLEIPQFGTKHSFNVSVTIGIVLWDLINKTKFLKK
ncbi:MULTISPECIES: RNA methyltransferase [Sphingobacterium]|uniref:RNA methyltransferase n=1 Tax=Sphingobacterium cellulitidis TaxID=1768011 RepID=A0A8H9G2D3_9SPHI|nr:MULTISPECIES: RNA methyltransferase [Sphingobacterium]MBA8988409.1 tRNA G18 (ribose-2'-O)-methylase SpoU [Sphingobacterium soli]OYD43346.1 RNA methyltransferase [Sphingobacterium cellulitidis]OYD47317.1 RNA methyltransferase [Sphingobacterium cellulitidis]WFB62744.1 RNA methyltransferase [Sphingobacterium sp. WM]GGE33041.1 RNA methyltransferase [Sphingobacterium soli]